ncbi:unnamed protein product [Cylindrotheca closterium]|uniref:Uncharacterized protein n=1 Tax=Cylindrotheca closterium TaxID=2856 RepID=A0AAD2GAP9_9STRA|nr:unnamed protein product [Cylindrotheca closterium]
MGNCVTQEMPQPQQRRRAPNTEEDEYETRSVATTPTRDPEVRGAEDPSSSNGYSPSEKEITEKRKEGLSKPIQDSAGASVCEPPIEEPPLIKHEISEPAKDTKDSAVAESPAPKKEEPDIVIPPEGGESLEAADQAEMKHASSRNLGKMGAEIPSDTDSMSLSSQVSSNEVEPAAAAGSHTVDKKPAKAPTSNSTFKRSAGIFLSSIGLLAGSIMLTQSSGPQDIQSILIPKAESLPRPPMDCKGDDCPFLNWLDTREGLCSPDQKRSVADVKFTPCPPYSSNSTLPLASAPACNFASWVDAQDKIDKCSLDTDKRFDQIWSKYM